MDQYVPCYYGIQLMIPKTQGKFGYPVHFDFQSLSVNMGKKWSMIGKLEAWLSAEISPINVLWCSLNYANSTVFYFEEEAQSIRFQLEMRGLLD